MSKYMLAVLAVSILSFGASAMAEDAHHPWQGNAHLDVRHTMTGAYPVDDIGSRESEDQWLNARLRLRTTFAASENIDLAAEGEVRALRLLSTGSNVGRTVGDDTFDVRRDGDAPRLQVIPRELSLKVLTPIGLFKCGHQAAHWGSGFLVNDGARQRLFGDGWDGNLVERCLVAGKIGQRFTFFAGGDYVYHDNNANYLEGDRAYGWTVGLRFTFDEDQAQPDKLFGLLFAQRFQTDRLDPRHPENRKTEADVNTIDMHFKWSFAAGKDAQFNWETEGAMIFGETDRPYLEETYENGASVLTFGAMSRLAYQNPSTEIALELGYASGDNDPQDDTIRQFTFNRAHTVGLLLFAHILPVTSARSADRTMDPGLLAVAPSGTRFTVNQGAVRNAAYLYPNIDWQFMTAWSLRGAYLYAVGAADVVDTFQSAVSGQYNTTIGGEQPGGRRYGQEFNVALVYHPKWQRLQGHITAEGGLFLPGDAFAGVLTESVSIGRINLGLDW